MPKQLPPVELLRQLLAYDPDTGALTWLPRHIDMFGGNVRSCGTWNTRYAGKPALYHLDAHGYRTGTLLGVAAKAHRVAWALHYGTPPAGQIDHINGDRADNRSSNLRDVSHSQNQRNAGVRADNKTGMPGVFRRKNGMYSVYVCGAYQGTATSYESAVARRLRLVKSLGFMGGHHKRKGRPKPP